ncbi:MAG TPA: hypothetical protein VFN20_02990 [Candidatus Acidoferrum sp.]|nr:hypothetical protein [Candidatus Acidoferrum sp.]
MKILIVDDDRLSRLLLARTPEKAGYGTELADSAEKANENSDQRRTDHSDDLGLDQVRMGRRFWRRFAARRGWLSCRY